MGLRFLLAPTLMLAAFDAPQQPSAPPDTIAQFIHQIERAVLSGNQEHFASLTAPTDAADAFWHAMSPAPDGIVIKERDRTALADGSQQLLLETLIIRDAEGRVGTWKARLVPTAAAVDDAPVSWHVAGIEELSGLGGLFRLSLDSSRQYAVSQLRIRAPDLTLSMDDGTAFLASVPYGATAIVLLGRGTMRFTPPDEAEQTQLKLFADASALDVAFDMTLLRGHPDDFAPLITAGMLTPEAVSASDHRRATRYFDETAGRSLTVDLGDLSRDRWSLVPRPADLVAEVRTRKFGGLTYARHGSAPEDVTLFDREHRKSISSYTSTDTLTSRGRFYSEDDTVDYDIESIELHSDIDPARSWIEGNATLEVVARRPLTTLALKLAESFTVRRLAADELGRLLFLRVVGQDSLSVTLPSALQAGARMTLRVDYGGRLEPQVLDPEAPPVRAVLSDPAEFELRPEPRYVYSTRSFWYPQSPVHDYATARLRISVPGEYQVVASGAPGGSTADPEAAGGRARTVFAFATSEPVPYLACVIGRFTTVTQTTVELPARGPQNGVTAVEETRPHTAVTPVTLTVQANPRQTSRAREVAARAATILRFYAGLLDDAPYSSLTVALSEGDAPGGHSPAHVAMIDQPLPTSKLVWRNDPVSFPGFRDYVLAHELAHQWWGQAVGASNYHERWISEGFAQYFTALYAEREVGAETLDAMLRQMQDSALDASSQGPIWLGSRLGHLRGDSRPFRAIVYNKSAMVLHMLRRLIGDDAFFRGLRNFYGRFRFRKAGTEDFRLAMEQASGYDLRPFIDDWIFGAAIPRLTISRTVSDSALTVTLEHTGQVLPVPITVTVVYTDGSQEHVIVPVDAPRVSRTIPLRTTLREVKVDEDHAALARFAR